ncbi:hypothetical protein N431DRAFT_467453 [Stipitochalara longipes BDJ]|nr:hypothetical protein N431DRAFT_467453 [Stipitochalara longipes BDJ]
MGSKYPTRIRQNRYKLRPRNRHGFVSPGQKYTAVHFYLLPIELRDMVFAFSLVRTDGKTPALLLALRGDKEMYLQALKVFYHVNEMEMRWQGGLGWFEELRGEVKEMVKKVVIAVPPTSAQVSALHSSLTTLPNLTSLKLRSLNTTYLTTFALPCFLSITNSKFNFQHLTKLTIEVRLKTDKYPTGSSGVILAVYQWADEFEAKEEIRKLNGEIDSLLRGKREHSWVVANCWDIFSVVWKAGKGEVLGAGEKEKRVGEVER